MGPRVSDTDLQESCSMQMRTACSPACNLGSTACCAWLPPLSPEDKDRSWLQCCILMKQRMQATWRSIHITQHYHSQYASLDRGEDEGKVASAGGGHQNGAR